MTISKKATLLIQNIHKLYTMCLDQDNNYIVLSHAFIAVYHDYILDCGIYDYRQYIDSDTRIIEGDALIVLPGFIDIDVKIPDINDHNQLLLAKHYLHHLSCKGVTSLSFHDNSISDEYYQNILRLSSGIQIIQNDTTQQDISVIHPLQEVMKASYKPFVLSSGNLHKCDDLLLCAREAYAQQIPAIQILEALSVFGAKKLGNDQIGSLSKHMQADFIIVGYKDIDAFFGHMGSSNILKVYKAGILMDLIKK